MDKTSIAIDVGQEVSDEKKDMERPKPKIMFVSYFILPQPP